MVRFGPNMLLWLGLDFYRAQETSPYRACESLFLRCAQRVLLPLIPGTRSIRIPNRDYDHNNTAPFHLDLSLLGWHAIMNEGDVKDCKMLGLLG